MGGILMDIKIIDAIKLLNDKLPEYKEHIHAISGKSNLIKLTRAQLQADMEADTRRGAFVTASSSAEHDKKCEKILTQDKNSNIVLFPEYCISYDLIERLASNKSLWPRETALWVLPCQGISHNDFTQKLEELKNINNVFVVDDHTKGKYINQDNFVNALMYCFVVVNETDDKKLVFIPQLKTRPMADSELKCEAYMTQGSIIYKLKKSSGNCIVSVICADTLDSDSLWQEMGDEDCKNNLILLHPQLNQKPRDTDFSIFRKKMWSHGPKNLYISANWARNTSVYVNNGNLMTIKEPWSCIYHRHESALSFDHWYKNHHDLLRKNPQKLLYGSYIKTKRVSIWYAWHSQLVQRITINAPFVPNAKSQPKPDTVADECLEWNGNEWIKFTGNEANYRKTLYLNESEHGNKTISTYVEKIVSNPVHEYPFANTTQKTDTDKFFEILLAKDAFSFTHAHDTTEVPISPLLLIETSNIEYMAMILRNYNLLINTINQMGFPSHLQFSNKVDDYKFTFSKQNGKPVNIVSGEKALLIVFIDDENEADKYLDNLKRSIQDDTLNESEFPYYVQVLTMNMGDTSYKFKPTLKTDITSGDAIDNNKDRTKGGN